MIVFVFFFYLDIPSHELSFKQSHFLPAFPGTSITIHSKSTLRIVAISRLSCEISSYGCELYKHVLLSFCDHSIFHCSKEEEITILSSHPNFIYLKYKTVHNDVLFERSHSRFLHVKQFESRNKFWK